MEVVLDVGWEGTLVPAVLSVAGAGDELSVDCAGAGVPVGVGWEGT